MQHLYRLGEISVLSNHPGKWFLLVHQIPPKPNALRVKIWRRLNQLGAVAIKQSVYVMPFTDEAMEDLSWMLKEIQNGGGSGFIAEATFLQGFTDEQIIALFQKARNADYEDLIREANKILSQWSSSRVIPQTPEVKVQAQMARLQRRFEKILSIDFFQAPERWRAEILIKDLANRLSGHSPRTCSTTCQISDLCGKTWVTRKNVFIDRIACGWLIRRFIDNKAVFKFVDSEPYAPAANEIRFDMFEGEYTHDGDMCSFEVMIQRLRLQDDALFSLAEVVHDIDLKDEKFSRPEAEGFSAMLSGLVASRSKDEERLADGFSLFDMLYAYFQKST